MEQAENTAAKTVEAAEEKKRIRREALRRRSELSAEERTKASLVITDRIIGHQWFYRADILLAFVGYGSEISTWGMIDEALRRGKKVYVPKVCGDRMDFYRIYDLNGLERGYKGIPEPSGSGEKYVYRPQDCEQNRTLMLMPGVAFDREKNRIGYGKGYYDRFLQDKEELRLHSIAIGFSCQMMEKLPCDEHDIKPYQIICV